MGKRGDHPDSMGHHGSSDVNKSSATMRNEARDLIYENFLSQK
ncbi:MAG: hypothetical protein ABEJ98_01900 [Candidatus Nanohaloarchaea archaeon]